MTEEHKKAEELIEMFDIKHYLQTRKSKENGTKGLPISMYRSQRKACAVLYVKGIIEVLEKVDGHYHGFFSPTLNFWNEVLKHLEG